MDKFFPYFFLVAEQESQQRSGDDSAPVAPIVDTGHQQTKKKKAYRPTTDLSVDGMPIYAAPAFT